MKFTIKQDEQGDQTVTVWGFQAGRRFAKVCEPIFAELPQSEKFAQMETAVQIAVNEVHKAQGRLGIAGSTE